MMHGQKNIKMCVLILSTTFPATFLTLIKNERDNSEIAGSNLADCMVVRLFFWCCADSGLCDGLITRTEGSYHVCTSV